MDNIILNNLYIVLLMPFWIFLIIMLGRFFSVYVNKILINVLSVGSSLFGLVLCSAALIKLPKDSIIEVQNQFIKINDFILSFGIHIDRISLIFAVVLFMISLMVQIYSISYMRNEKKNYRFYALLNLFNFVMLALFFSPNLFQTYFFWEIAGVVSYLLIGFEYFKEKKSIASKKVFIINRIGDTAFLGALILSSYYIYSYSNNYHLTTLSFTDMNILSTLIYAYTSTPLFYLICGLYIVGAITKSAQFPFYTWLADAMEAKLPVSALLHSSTLVAAGVFLLLRLLPFYTLEPILLKSLVVVGSLTALVCSVSACSQTEGKRVLAYSTSAQFGLVILAIGLLNIKAAIAYFIAHAFIKSMLFLTLPRENEKWNYIYFSLFIIGGFSLSGLIFSGLIAKEMLAINVGMYGTILFSLISFLTAFYIIRIAFVIFQKHSIEKKVPNKYEIISVFGLLFANIIFYIYLHKNVEYQIAESFWAALTSAIVVYVLYLKNAFWKVPLLYQLSLNGFYLDKFYTKICAGAYETFCKFCNLIDLKVLGNYSPLIWTGKVGVKFVDWIETNLINGAVTFVANIFGKISEFNKRAQNGNIQRYNAYAFAIITLVLIGFVIGYYLIISIIGG